MNNWLFVIVLIMLATIWHWFHNAKNQSMRQVRVQARKEPANFHGVSIRPCSRSCSSVQEMKKQRFLSAETPPLPLEGCSRLSCECSYVHHKDRRHIDDRRFLNGMHQNDRRIRADRRDQSFA